MCIGGGTPSAPPPPKPLPPSPQPQDPATISNRETRRAQANLAAGGRQSTVLTGGLGLTTPATGARKTLLGQ